MIASSILPRRRYITSTMINNKKIGCLTTAYAMPSHEASCCLEMILGPYSICLNLASAPEIPFNKFGSIILIQPICLSRDVRNLINIKYQRNLIHTVTV